jgi:hypothetical protein
MIKNSLRRNKAIVNEKKKIKIGINLSLFLNGYPESINNEVAIKL